MLKCAVQWTPLDSNWTVSYIHRNIEVSSPVDSTRLQVDCVIYIHRDVEVYSPVDSTRLQVDCLIYIHIEVSSPLDSRWTVSYIFTEMLKCAVHWTPLDSNWTVSYIFIEMLKCAVHWTVSCIFTLLDIFNQNGLHKAIACLNILNWTLKNWVI